MSLSRPHNPAGMSVSRTHRKPVIGVVGGIGSGKSTVAKELAALGCDLVDCDAVGHELLRRPRVRGAFRGRWGAGVFNKEGQVSRPAVAKIVFADVDEMDFLESLLHPGIRRRIAERIAAARRRRIPAVVVDAAVLFEAGWDDLCTHTIFVESPRKNRLERIARTRGWGREDVRKRESRQIPLDRKARRCSYSLSNRSSLSHLREQVRRVLHRIIHDKSHLA
jgi:dephospho-CoA kinase